MDIDHEMMLRGLLNRFRNPRRFGLRTDIDKTDLDARDTPAFQHFENMLPIAANLTAIKVKDEPNALLASVAHDFRYIKIRRAHGHLARRFKLHRAIPFPIEVDIIQTRWRSE